MHESTNSIHSGHCDSKVNELALFFCVDQRLQNDDRQVVNQSKFVSHKNVLGICIRKSRRDHPSQKGN